MDDRESGMGASSPIHDREREPPAYQHGLSFTQ